MSDFWQTAVTALLVLAAFGYTSWTFIPGRWRQRLLRRYGFQTTVASAASGAACAACRACSPKPAPTEAVITWRKPADRLSSKL